MEEIQQFFSDILVYSCTWTLFIDVQTVKFLHSHIITYNYHIKSTKLHEVYEITRGN